MIAIENVEIMKAQVSVCVSMPACVWVYLCEYEKYSRRRPFFVMQRKFIENTLPDANKWSINSKYDNTTTDL